MEPGQTTALRFSSSNCLVMEARTSYAKSLSSDNNSGSTKTFVGLARGKQLWKLRFDPSIFAHGYTSYWIGLVSSSPEGGSQSPRQTNIPWARRRPSDTLGTGGKRRDRNQRAVINESSTGGTNSRRSSQPVPLPQGRVKPPR